MIRHLRTCMVLVACAMTSSAALAEEAAGRWTGAIDNHLLTFITLEKAADGTYSGTYSSHEQPVTTPDAHAVMGGVLTGVTATGDHLHFEVPAVGGAIFDGAWDDRRRRWVGTFQWGKDGYKSQLTLRRTTSATLADALKPRVYASPAEEAAEMSALIDAYVVDSRFMGIVLVSRGDQVLIDKGYGLADMVGNVPNTPATRYRIASITKPFTATAVLMLQDRGKLSIDDPIGKYIPDAPKSWDGITLRHLLRHTSGLGDYNRIIQKRYDRDFTPAQLLKIIRGMTPATKPGETYQYSNAGYALLGMVIEKVSGQSYGDFLHDAIFAPLHMDATAYNPVFDAATEARGYEVGDTAPLPAAPRALSNTFSAGGIVSTTHDLRKWQQALFGGKLISAGALAGMIAEGQGLAVTSPDGYPLYGHSGHLPGYVSDASFQPDGALSVIVLGNLDNSSPVWISQALTTAAHGFPAEIVPLPKAIALPIETLKAYAGTYRLMPGMDLRVTVEGDHLLVKATGQTAVRAWPQSETVFFAKAVEARLEFVRGKDGQVSCILHQAGQHIVGTRR